MVDLDAERSTYGKARFMESICLNSAISKILAKSVREVFNTAFFISLEDTVNSLVDTELPYEATISFSGAFQGHITLLCNRPLVEQMLENSINIEAQDILEPIIEDCLKETLNMVCGRFLKDLSPRTRVIFSLPEVKKTDIEESRGESCLFLNGGRGAYLKAIIQIEGGPQNGQKYQDSCGR
ncbi:MAG: chemotaxis protein CheX [Syntrophales bacterium]|nr:chemotaxis protein CheX [Syntrophales bacterium]